MPGLLGGGLPRLGPRKNPGFWVRGLRWELCSLSWGWLAAGGHPVFWDLGTEVQRAGMCPGHTVCGCPGRPEPVTTSGVAQRHRLCPSWLWRQQLEVKVSRAALPPAAPGMVPPASPACGVLPSLPCLCLSVSAPSVSVSASYKDASCWVQDHLFSGPHVADTRALGRSTGLPFWGHVQTTSSCRQLFHTRAVTRR